MEMAFSRTLARLRREKGLSQRKVAGDLNISQALLSHYENGAREPGLNFVCRACDYYGVTADYLLGRAIETVSPDSPADSVRVFLGEFRALADKAQHIMEELK